MKRCERKDEEKRDGDYFEIQVKNVKINWCSRK